MLTGAEVSRRTFQGALAGNEDWYDNSEGRMVNGEEEGKDRLPSAFFPLSTLMLFAEPHFDLPFRIEEKKRKRNTKEEEQRTVLQ